MPSFKKAILFKLFDIEAKSFSSASVLARKRAKTKSMRVKKIRFLRVNNKGKKLFRILGRRI